MNLPPSSINDRWYTLRYHPEQSRYWQSTARFNVVPAGRRSGKTELAKRKLIRKGLQGTPFHDPRFFAGAPTRDQAKRIYWKDLKRMTPKHLQLRPPSESHLTIYLINYVEIVVIGLDKPERIEGTPWDGGILDEYANMKAKTWSEHVRAALSDRKGWCDFIGVPEGRNHYYDLYREAKARAAENREKRLPLEWDTFWWPSEDILDADEIASAKRDLDELVYEQEYRASFVSFTGRAYYNFDERTHCATLQYDKEADLEFCFDFNVAPGCAVVMQEQWLPTSRTEETWGDGIIGEVFIPRNSNTVMVCDRLIHDWGDHKGRIICYGDSTGGSKKSSSILGSDWQLIKEKLWSHYGPERVHIAVPKANPSERERVNSMNSRLKTISGDVRCMIDPAKAPHTVRDFEGTTTVEGGSGELDKNADQNLTHLTDACGYRVWRKYPVKKQYAQSGQKYWK